MIKFEQVYKLVVSGVSLKYEKSEVIWNYLIYKNL